MRLLRDTHVLLWWLDGGAMLGPEACAAIADPATRIDVSAASVWEVAIKQSLGKLRAPAGLLEQLERHRFAQLPVTGEHALRAGLLPRHHDDPFDRMLIAQAEIEGLCVVTRDPAFAAYGVQLLAA